MVTTVDVEYFEDGFYIFEEDSNRKIGHIFKNDKGEYKLKLLLPDEQYSYEDLIDLAELFKYIVSKIN